jgi:hypothetical protein
MGWQTNRWVFVFRKTCGMMRLHNQSCRFSLSGKPAGLEEKHNV